MITVFLVKTTFSTRARIDDVHIADFYFRILFLFRDSHFTLDSDSSWLDFLTKAIDHNMNKITSVLHELEETNT